MSEPDQVLLRTRQLKGECAADIRSDAYSPFIGTLQTRNNKQSFIAFNIIVSFQDIHPFAMRRSRAALLHAVCHAQATPP